MGLLDGMAFENEFGKEIWENKSKIRFYGDTQFSPKDHCNVKAKHIPFIYFHGKLEDILNFDLVFSETPEKELPLGIYDCLVGDKLNCKAFFYKSERSLRGFIVLQNDIDGLKDAQEAYDKQLSIL